MRQMAATKCRKGLKIQEHATSLNSAASSRLQRKPLNTVLEESETAMDDCAFGCMQRKATRHSSGLIVPTTVNTVLRSPGRALDATTRSMMQRRFNHDFSHVRIHDDSSAATSAAAVSARAYTVGNHIVFGEGGFRSGSPAGQRLLAHELTHVIQQQNSSQLAGNPRHLEAEAEQVESAYAESDAMVPVKGGGVMLARNGNGEEGDVEERASAAESACDIQTLCQLRFQAPARVDDARVRRAFSTCHPSISTVGFVLGSPCLTPNFGLPRVPGDAGSSATGPSSGSGTSAGATGSSGGLSLPSTTIRFRIGAAPIEIDLPSSLSIQLPVPFRGASLVVFSLNASASEFSFSAAINAVPHVRITATTRMTTSGVGSAGLTVESRRRTCRAQEAAASRAALQSRSEQLVDAIRAATNPPPVPEDASTLERTFAPHMRMADVVGAVAGLHSAIERARGACRDVPVVSAEFGVRGQLTQPEPGEEAAPTYLGGGITLHF